MPSGCSPRFAHRRNHHDIGPKAGLLQQDMTSTTNSDIAILNDAC